MIDYMKKFIIPIMFFMFICFGISTVNGISEREQLDITDCSNGINYNISGWVLEEKECTDVKGDNGPLYEKTISINNSFSISDIDVPINKNSITFTFVYDKNNYVAIKNNKVDCVVSENLPKKYKTVSTRSIRRSANQMISSNDFILYENFSFKEQRRINDANIDISCTPAGEINLYGRGFECLNADENNPASSNETIISDTKNVNKDKSSERVIISKIDNRYNKIKKDADYKYVTQRIRKIYYDSSNNCVSKGYVDLYFRYNNMHKECKCIGASFGSRNYDSEYNLRTFAKPSNLSLSKGDGTAEFELKTPGKTKYIKSFASCDSDGNFLENKWVDNK